VDIPLETAIAVASPILGVLVGAIGFLWHRLDREKAALVAQMEARRQDEVLHRKEANDVGAAIARLVGALDEVHEDRRLLLQRLEDEGGRRSDGGKHPSITGRRPGSDR